MVSNNYIVNICRVYLQQLPSWPDLVRMFDVSDVELMAGLPQVEAAGISHNLYGVLPVSQPLRA